PPTDTPIPPTDTPTPPSDTQTPEATSTVEETATATSEVTPEATVTVTDTAAPSQPVFIFPDGITTFSVNAGAPLTFQFTVSDDSGAVNVSADTTGASGIVGVTTTPPIETAPPYNTRVSVNYTAPVSFSGADTFMLTAINSANVTGTIAVAVNVSPPAPTEE